MDPMAAAKLASTGHGSAHRRAARNSAHRAANVRPRDPSAAKIHNVGVGSVVSGPTTGSTAGLGNTTAQVLDVRDGAAVRTYQIEGGFADVTPDGLTILAESAVETA